MDANTSLAPGARLFHVGPPKTGTTSLQWAAAEHRPELLADGVRYPGRTRNHRLAVGAFLGRRTGWTDAGADAGAPAMRHWYELLGELDAESVRRTWFGHEYAAHATPAQIQRFADELGPSLTVVITLRSFAQMLPSMWQEHLKAAGGRGSFEPWLRSMLRSTRAAHAKRQQRHDHAAMVERWAGVLGAERLRVVVLDRADHDFAFRAFEQLLALPSGLLTSRRVPSGLNRSMTAPEVELLRRLNEVTRDHHIAWSNHERLVVQGAVARMLAARSDAPALRLPAWAVPLANRTALDTASRIEASGVPIIGNPANLAEPVEVRDDVVDHRSVTDVPIDVAVDALAGMLAAATGLEPDFGRQPDRAARTVLLHSADDLRGVRQAGVGAVAKAVASRTAKAAEGLGYAGRGWLSRRFGR